MFYLFINLYLFLGSLKEYWFGIIPNSSLLLFLALFWGVGGVVVLVWTVVHRWQSKYNTRDEATHGIFAF